MKVTNSFIVEPTLTYENKGKQFFEQALIKSPNGYPVALVHMNDFFWDPEKEQYLRDIFNTGETIKVKITIEVEE